MEQNLKQKTLESLEQNIWSAINSNEESYLAVTCNDLRKKKLIDFSIEDLRIMIGQNIGLKYLIPIAVDLLNENILAEGDFYEGDLLSAVLSSDIKFWKAEKNLHMNTSALFQKNELLLKNFDTTLEIKKKWFALFKEFEAIH